MAIWFERPVGAAADVRELEYISALHQTDLSGIRQNGSIVAQDIELFLKSRHGVVVTEEEVHNQIINCFGGGTNGSKCIDLMELVAMLIIPTLLKSKQQLQQESDQDGQHISIPNRCKLVLSESNLLKRIWAMILEDCNYSPNNPPKLSKELLGRIFREYGETVLAADDTLLQEMLQAANPGWDENSDTCLSFESFCTALTNDVAELYDVQNEFRRTTILDDVMLSDGGRVIQSDTQLDPSRELNFQVIQERSQLGKEVTRINTRGAIDSTAATFRSKPLLTILSATVIITYFAYWYGGISEMLQNSSDCPTYAYSYSTPWNKHNSISMACESGISIGQWLGNFFTFCLFGLFFVGLGSIGNSVENHNRCRPLFGMVFCFLIVAVPYIGREGDEVRGKYYLDNVSLILGLLACALHLCNFLVLTINVETIRGSRFLRWILRGSLLEAERDAKRGGAHKMGLLVQNAFAIVTGGGENKPSEDLDRRSVLRSHFGRGLERFANSGETLEKTGGFQWTWERIWDRRMSREYGLHYSSRLISSNIAQCIVSLYIIIAGINLTRNVLENFDEDDAKEVISATTRQMLDRAVDDDLLKGLLLNMTSIFSVFLASQSTPEGIFNCSDVSLNTHMCKLVDSVVAKSASFEEQLDLYASAGLDVDSMHYEIGLALGEAAEASVDSLYPSSRYMVAWPLAIGTIWAFTTSVYLAITFLPSATSTVLKLRSGVILSLNDKDFNKYRFAQDQASLIMGSMFWGNIIASVLVGGLVGLLVFLCLWQATVYFVQRAFAICIGIIAVALLRLGLLTLCRGSMYGAFYRKKPKGANTFMLALEWANFILSVGFVFLRMIKLLIAASYFIGRIDTPFLAQHVGKIGNFELDNYPTIYLKGVLAHEAHRHPYMDILGTVYLMKIRYREHFASRAGSAWRLLFVYALMPWMHKYRVRVGQEGSPLVYVKPASTRVLGKLLARAGNRNSAWKNKEPSPLLPSIKDSLRIEDDSEVDEYGDLEQADVEHDAKYVSSVNPDAADTSESHIKYPIDVIVDSLIDEISVSDLSEKAGEIAKLVDQIETMTARLQDLKQSQSSLVEI